VWFIGAVLGSGPMFKVPLAWLDVPADPFAPTIAARIVLEATAQSTIAGALPAAGQGVLLVQGDASKAFPTALVGAPLADLATLAVFPNSSFAPGASPAASSGGRLVFYRWEQAQQAFAGYFSLENAAGTSGAMAAAEQNTAADVGQIYGFGQIAQGAGGALLWGASVIASSGALAFGTKYARVAWLLDGDTDTTFDAKTQADVETYDPEVVTFSESVMGPIAWIDADTALVLAKSPANLGQTSVQVATRNGTTGSLVPNRRVVLPVSVDKLGAVATGGLGYVVAAEPADAGNSATVYVFAPGCAAGDAG
jgi:hypothetical protein